MFPWMKPRGLAESTLIMLATLLSGNSAAAHIRMLSPQARYGDAQKVGPCGVAGGERGPTELVLTPGATLELVFEEYINHPSHYRVSFDDDGDDDFRDPAGYDDYYSHPSVLLDAIADEETPGPRTLRVQLPDVECERCTLQLVQVMYDKPPYTTPGNDLYYQCVNLALRASADDGDFDAGSTDAGAWGDASMPGREDPEVDAMSQDDPLDGSTPSPGAPLPTAGGTHGSCAVAAARTTAGGALASLMMVVVASCALGSRRYG